MVSFSKFSTPIQEIKFSRITKMAYMADEKLAIYTRKYIEDLFGDEISCNTLLDLDEDWKRRILKVFFDLFPYLDWSDERAQIKRKDKKKRPIIDASLGMTNPPSIDEILAYFIDAQFTMGDLGSILINKLCNLETKVKKEQFLQFAKDFEKEHCK